MGIPKHVFEEAYALSDKIHCKYLPDPPAEIRLDLAIMRADNEVRRVNEANFQLFHAEFPQSSELGASAIIESMLPHKQILKDRLGDLDTQFRIEHYGFL